MESHVNLMHPHQRLLEAPRCTATAKATGCRCKAPAIKGWRVCRMHGARGGAPSGPRNGRWKHGQRTAQTESAFRAVRALAKLASEVALEVKR